MIGRNNQEKENVTYKFRQSLFELLQEEDKVIDEYNSAVRAYNIQNQAGVSTLKYEQKINQLDEKCNEVIIKIQKKLMKIQRIYNSEGGDDTWEKLE